MATAAETRDYLTKTYLAAFLRAPELSGLNYWSTEVLVNGKTLTEVGGTIFSIDVVTQIYPVALTDTQFVEAIYHNVFGKVGDDDGIAYWTEQLVAMREASTSDNAFFEARGQLVFNMIEAGLNTPDGTPGKLYIENRLEAANDAVDQQIAAAGDVAPADLAAVMSTVNADPATVVAAHDAIAILIAGVEPVDFSLTVGLDNILGNGQDNIFHANLAQNDLGSVVNTFESGDTLDGLGGRNELHADLAATGAPSSILGTTTGPTISAITTNIQEVYLHAQYPNVLDTTIDAERMTGVEQWWSDNSRSTITIEDIRSRPDDTFFGMTQTDPLPLIVGAPLFSTASFYAAFDPAQLSNDISSVDSSMTITMTDLINPADELQNIPIDGINFTLNGVAYSVRDDAMANADTYAQFVTALQAELATVPALAALTVVLNADNTITVTDPAGGIFVPSGVTFLNNTVPVPLNIAASIVQGAPTTVIEAIETNIVLDDVGRSSQGGEMVVGSMAEGGVDVFNVLVGRDSWVSGLASRSYVDPISTAIPLLTGIENVLDTVNVSHLDLGSTSDLTIGETTVDPTAGVSTTDDDRVSTDGFLKASPLAFLLPINAGGLQDVRVFNAEGFQGDVKVAADITFFSTDKYLAGAAEPVQFSYLMGEGDDNLSLFIDGGVVNDPDFLMEIAGNGGDDRFNLDTNGGTNANISLDGGAGENTLATAASSTLFDSFENIQHVIVEGFNFTTQNMDHYDGVNDIIIATESNVSTTVTNLAADMDLVVSGMNQTLGAGNSDADQYFGAITVTNALNPDLVVTLDNTARNTGMLDIDTLTIDGATSAVRTLTIDSTGARSTTNEIDVINAAMVNTFVFEGTQQLEVGENQFVGTGIRSASNHTAAPASVMDFTVDATGLEESLNLSINSEIIDNVDGSGKKVMIEGTDATTDRLLLDTNVGPSFTTTANTTITGFETIEFGFTGPVRWDDTNVSGVNSYVLNDAFGALPALGFLMDNMEATANINFVNGLVYDADFQINAASRAAGSQVNFTFTAADTTNLGYIAVNDYETISINAGTSTDIDLVLWGYEEPALTDKANYANSVVLTGGADATVLNMTGDLADTSGISASVSVIDLSGFKGDFVGSFQDTQDETGVVVAGPSVLNTNTTILVGAQTFIFDNGLFDNGVQTFVNNKITTFAFTADAQDVTENWVIDSFQAASLGTTTLSNASFLDLSALGVTSLAQLNIDIVSIPGNTIITSATGLNFEIQLTGVSMNVATDVVNFVFA